MLQYLMEPIHVVESRFKYIQIRRTLSQVNMVAQIRARIGFFTIYNLFDQVEMKCAETDVTR